MLKKYINAGDDTESNSYEEDISKIIDQNGGLIDKKMASQIKNTQEGTKSYQKLTVDLLLKHEVVDGSIVNIEDKVYRVFNKIKMEINGTPRIKRVVVLGAEARTVSISLWDKNCNFIDSMLIQRGDSVSISSLKVRKVSDDIELSSTSGTYISRVVPSYNFKSNFSELSENERNIDIMGRILSVSPIRYFKDLDGKQSGVSECSITDGKTEAHVTLWRSSSGYSTDMHPGAYIKLEFVSVKKIDDKLEITATDASRILIGQGLGSLIGKIGKNQ